MADEVEVIKQQMTETRTSLSEKLEKLENQVVSAVRETTDTVTSLRDAVSDTVGSVKSAVTDTVDSVKESFAGTVEGMKDSVSDTVDSVKSAFDLRSHVEAHPWAMLGGAAALGYLLGRLLPSAAAAPARPQRSGGPSNGKQRARAAAARQAFESTPAPLAASAAPPPEPAKSAFSDVLHVLGDAMAPAIDSLKGMAIGTTTGLLGEMVLNAVPEALKDDVRRAVGDITTKLGGREMWRPGESGLFEGEEKPAKQEPWAQRAGFGPVHGN